MTETGSTARRPSAVAGGHGRRKSMSRFGRQPVADILKRQGLTRVAVAEELGIKLSVFNNTLAGHQTPSQAMRDGLVKVLKMPLEELFTEEPLARVHGRRYRAGAEVSRGDDTKIRRLTPAEREQRRREAQVGA